MINNDEINHTKTIIMSKYNNNLCLEIAAYWSSSSLVVIISG